jgi:hypothetical protein
MLQPLDWFVNSLHENEKLHIMDLHVGIPVSLSDSDGGEVTDAGMRVHGTGLLRSNGGHASFGSED